MFEKSGFQQAPLGCEIPVRGFYHNWRTARIDFISGQIAVVFQHGSVHLPGPALPVVPWHTGDDSQIKRGEYLDRVADAFGLQHVRRISSQKAQRVLPELLLSFIN